MRKTKARPTKAIRKSKIENRKFAHILGVVRARITAAFFFAGSSTPWR
jgi:hypothetical protein